MKLFHPNDQREWDDFVSALPYAQFTQSWAWGELQKSVGREVVRYFVASDEGADPIAALQLIHQARPVVGGYWLAPRGPVFASGLEQAIKEAVLDFLSRELQLPAGLFIRLEPQLLATNYQLPMAFIPHRSYNPATTVLIDLKKSQDELLAAMHQKTRYNVRVAERHGVTVRVGTDEEIGTFLRLTKETEERDRFSAPDFSYLEKTYRVMAKAGIARLRIAEYQNEPLAMSMEMAYGDTVTYLHGASSSRHRNVMAPFTLHWEAMRAAKQEGKTIYDFWGCNPEDVNDPNYKPSWEGITRFKLGWGGARVNLVGTFDVPYKPWLYNVLKSAGRV
ncbi:peptidoglycan bridge formation glycyltransferase FemA/FemB family protein [Candidatus Uhrbacteria bacterium]|nr:MAG: peptidoglycan bridge formation glycyltransferase FemA/FemB family protein [Candidatus Uhrbacteria bacterium]